LADDFGPFAHIDFAKVLVISQGVVQLWAKALAPREGHHQHR
jgi:hypothetical protein